MILSTHTLTIPRDVVSLWYANDEGTPYRLVRVQYSTAHFVIFMRVLTFGWDYPPIRNGGLGVACFGLTEELLSAGLEVIFVLPRSQPTIGRPSFRFAEGKGTMYIRELSFPLLRPYQSGNSFVQYFLPNGQSVQVSRRIIDEARRYALEAAKIALEEEFDIIHAHDWTAYLAGMAAKEVSEKPLVLHVHATAYDQAGREC